MTSQIVKAAEAVGAKRRKQRNGPYIEEQVTQFTDEQLKEFYQQAYEAGAMSQTPIGHDQ